jgi:steroid delta-isomerase-like uncharacterized protein
MNEGETSMNLPLHHFSRRTFLSRAAKLSGGTFISLAGAPVSGMQKGRQSRSLAQVVKDCYAAYATLDVERVLTFYAEDCRFEDHTFHLSLRGKDELRKMFNRNRPLILEMRFDISNLIVSGNWVVVQHTQSGLLKPPKAPDAAPKKYSVQGASILEFAHGGILRQTDYYDVVTFNKQVDHNHP